MLMEIMIVGMIIGILAAIAIPAFMHSAQLSRQNMCINNMRQIEKATDQAAEELGFSTGQVPAAATVNSYIKGGTPTRPGSDGIRIPRWVPTHRVPCTAPSPLQEPAEPFP